MGAKRSNIGVSVLFFLVGLRYMSHSIAECNPIIEEDAKVDPRRDLHKMTQDLLTAKDPLYHSYIFNSGVGNREDVEVELLRKEPRFSAGVGVKSWQSVRNAGLIYLLGRRNDSVSLVITSDQLLSNRSAHFSEYLLELETNISSTSLFTRWNPVTSHSEVIVVIAVNTSSGDIFWFRVVDNKLEKITDWARYRKTSSLTAINVSGKTHLLVVDTDSPATVNLFYVIFATSGVQLDFSLVQSVHLTGPCECVTLSRVGHLLYVAFLLPQSVSVYKLLTAVTTNVSHLQHHESLNLPRVSQVITFSVALQVYLAVNGDSAYVLRLTEEGDFIPELMPGNVSEWLAAPVFSYRSDVVLFSRNGNVTKAFVWAGATKGFINIVLPECESCLEGDWSGAVYIPFRHQNCLLLPQTGKSSSLITVDITLQNNYPLLEKLKVKLDSMKHYENKWQTLKSKLSKAVVIKKNGKNTVTGNWELCKLVNSSSIPVPTEAINIDSLNSLVAATSAAADELIRAVDQKQREVWGLDGFTGKITFNSHLIVENLTCAILNRQPVDHILQNTFKKDNPQPIPSSVVESLQVDNIIINKINDSLENLKFTNEPVVIRGNMTFTRPLTIKGNVTLLEGGRVNSVDLSEHLCQGKDHCSVFPIADMEVRGKDPDNTINKVNEHTWRHVLAGKNLTVLYVNGVDWNALTQHVVYKDSYQYIPGTVVINGTLSFGSALLAGTIDYNYRPTQKKSEISSPISEESLGGRRSSVDAEILEDAKFFDPNSDIVISELEVTGTVTCSDSEWGSAAADVVLSNTDPVQIYSIKRFSETVSVTNNLEVKGSVGGVNVSDLLTDNDQIFQGCTTLSGNITLGNVTVTGLWDGVNVTDLGVEGASVSSSDVFARYITADTVRVMETLNSVPISELMFTNSNNITVIESVNVESLDVTEDITMDGKICGQNFTEFNERRFSLHKEQNITGKVIIKSIIADEFNLDVMNDVEVSSFLNDFDNHGKIYLRDLYIEGDITTNQGVNGYNLTEVAASAVWLKSNNDIQGLIFKDEVMFDVLECSGYLNGKPYEYWFDVADVVYKTNETVYFSGEKTFLNELSISEDLSIEEINSHQVKDILTKTTEQEIRGDVIITGDMTISEESTVIGLLNSQNLKEFGHKCSLSENTVSCKGNVVFKDRVSVKHFNSTGEINGVNFDDFVKSLVTISDNLFIKGYKNFTAPTVIVENLEVRDINNHNWDNFLLNVITVNAHEEVDAPVVFTEKVTVNEISVNYNVNADSVNDVDFNEWRKNAIYINKSGYLSRDLHLNSASTLGNLSLVMYDGLDLEHDTVKLHVPSSTTVLRCKSVTVTEEVETPDTVNGHILASLQENSFKKSGDQIVKTDLVFMGNVTVSENVITMGEVNHFNLQEVVTLTSDQTLDGSYNFECVEVVQNITHSESMSGVDMSTWGESAVLKNGDQAVTGVWSVVRDVEFRGAVHGKGRLADVDLAQLTDNITRDILDVHKEMESNLTSACENTNQQLARARSQPLELLYWDISQEFLVPSGVALTTHFQSGGENYLAVCEKGCTTTIYKWSSLTGSFSRLYSEMLGLAVEQLVVLHESHLTYLVTVSSDLRADCDFYGNHIWLFTENHIKHISSVELESDDLLQGDENIVYSKNASGVFKWKLHYESGSAVFKSTQKWKVDTGGKKFVPREAGVGLALQDQNELISLDSKFGWLSQVYSSRNCTGEVQGLSVDPSQRFMAVATMETAQIPRYSDHVKVYRHNGQLFDKVPAERASHIQWLNVPTETWFAFLQNHTTLQLYQLRGILEGFQLKISAKINADSLSSLALPLWSKVNPQPFLILQTTTSVKILQAFLQGDPFLEANMTCNFEEALLRVPTL